MKSINNTFKTVALETLGCKLNQAETDSLARRFLLAGYRLVDFSQKADVFVINTCTVTHIADRKSRHLIRLANRLNPEALIVVTGCYSERAGHEIASIDGVGLVVGNRDKERLPELVAARFNGSPEIGVEAGGHHSLARTRALVKIQDGCGQSCSYCIVPRVRDKETSLPEESIVEQVRDRVAEGYREVVLTGTQIGSYGGDRGCFSLAGLVRRILAETSVERLRLTSIQPQDLVPELLGLWEERRLCRHLHIPLQSGSDGVLRRMGRRYSSSEYRDAVERARRAIPDISIAADVIVGFPGETEGEFEDSLRFCQDMGLAALHVFPYSARPGTPASRMPARVPEPVKEIRRQKMLELARQSAWRFRERYLGRCLEVLFEESKDGRWVGLTDNYLRVFVPGQEGLHNTIKPVDLVAHHKMGLLGVVQNNGNFGHQ